MAVRWKGILDNFGPECEALTEETLLKLMRRSVIAEYTLTMKLFQLEAQSFLHVPRHHPAAIFHHPT